MAKLNLERCYLAADWSTGPLWTFKLCALAAAWGRRFWRQVRFWNLARRQVTAWNGPLPRTTKLSFGDKEELKHSHSTPFKPNVGKSSKRICPQLSQYFPFRIVDKIYLSKNAFSPTETIVRASSTDPSIQFSNRCRTYFKFVHFVKKNFYRFVLKVSKNWIWFFSECWAAWCKFGLDEFRAIGSPTKWFLEWSDLNVTEQFDSLDHAISNRRQREQKGLVAIQQDFGVKTNMRGIIPCLQWVFSLSIYYKQFTVNYAATIDRQENFCPEVAREKARVLGRLMFIYVCGMLKE